MAHGGHTPRTTLGGYSLEFIYPEAPEPSLITSRGQASRLRSQRTMAHNEFSQGMASTRHILLGNHAVNRTKGPAPMSTLGHGLDLHLRNLGPVAYGGHTLGTAHGGCILEFTNIGGPLPSLITSRDQDFHPGSQMAIAHGDLARGMAHGGHILSGNHEIARANEATPITSSYLVQTRHVAKLDPMVESHPGQCLCHRIATSQGAHEQRSYPPP